MATAVKVPVVSLSVRIEGASEESRGQTVDYIEHVNYTDRTDADLKLRVRIHDDSYADQAYALLEKWDGTRWHEVVSIRGVAMLLKHGVGYRRLTHAQAIAEFAADRNHLLRLAQEVLS